MKLLLAESENFSPKALHLLQEYVEVDIADLERNDLLKRLGSFDILWVRLRNHIDQAVLDAGSKALKVIVSPTTGLNHIDLDTADERGITVLSLKGEVDFLKEIRATAEHTIALTLALLRNLPSSILHVHAGQWNRDLFRGHELLEKTVGIIGYGRLGQIVSQYFQAFGCNVMIHDPHVTEADHTLEEVLHQSDIISLHVDLNPSTTGFFDDKKFQSMKPGAWFINTSRGELVDETAMLEHLKSGRLAGAAVDVLTNEHAADMKNHPMVQYAQSNDNLLITPHIGGCTYESMEKTELFMVQKLITWIKQQCLES